MSGFNSGFYETEAAVIPVFFLALTVQGRTYEDFMGRWTSSAKQTPAKFWPQVRFIGSAFAATALAFTIFFGAYGEFLALSAIYNQHATATIQQSVLISSIALLIVIAAIPAYVFMAAYIGTLAEDYRRVITKRRRREAASEESGSGFVDTGTSTSTSSGAESHSE